MLNRNQAPEATAISNIAIQKAEETSLSNGIKLSYINAGSQELLKIEIQIPVGSIHHENPLVAGAVNSLLREGTQQYSSAYIAEFLDAHGAFLESETYKHHSSVILYCLNKHLNKLLPVFYSIITEPLFSENEFEIYFKKQKQSFLVNMQKVDGIARQHFSENLFGKNHAYGITANQTNYDTLSVESLKLFHQQNYIGKGARIVVSGFVNEDVTRILSTTFSNIILKDLQEEKSTFQLNGTQGEVLIPKNDAIQSAIRIGRPMFNKLHPDFQKMLVLNTILGGYFGSRLMSNIREDKGYTYGISSGIVSLKNGGYFYIATEVGVDVCKNALKEIYFELNRLQTELVGEEELSTVKNYMLGSFLRSLSGPFELADKYNGLLDYNLDYNYYEQYLKTINAVSAEELRDLAKQYFKKEELLELVVGKIINP